jgi:Zn-dependent peptidase ImmA (M78 family)
VADQLQLFGENAEFSFRAAADNSAPRFNGQMLALAREAIGRSQKEFATLAGFNQSRLSKLESGGLIPHESDFQKFVVLLGREREFFFQQGPTTPASVSFYRKTQTLPLRMFRQCNAQMNVCRLEIERRIGKLRLGRRELPHLPPERNGGASAVAQMLRKEWKLSHGAVLHLTALVEDCGCVVVDHSFPSPKLDGLSIRSPGKSPIIFLNRDLPKSRRRLSLVHELGHLVMHTNPHERVEDEAWDFAAEFLVPAAEIQAQFSDLNLDKLGLLKSEWGVSMQALLYRATKLGKISESYSRFLWTQIGKFGYRINEPFEDLIPEERPTELEKRIKMTI